MGKLLSNIMHRAAVTWGFPLLFAGQFDIDQRCVEIAYVKQPIPTKELIEIRGDDNEFAYSLRLFTLNDMWGYSVTSRFHDQGSEYLSFLKFCNPYPSRIAAIKSALTKLLQDENGNNHTDKAGIQMRKVIAFLENEINPKQLELF